MDKMEVEEDQKSRQETPPMAETSLTAPGAPLSPSLITQLEPPRATSPSPRRPKRQRRAPKKDANFVYGNEEEDEEPPVAPVASTSKRGKGKGKAKAKEEEEEDATYGAGTEAGQGEGEPVKRKAPKPKPVKIGGWDWHFPDWTGSDANYLFSCPPEIIDKILGSEALNIRDHLSLAAACKCLRNSYYTPPPSLDKATLPNSILWRAIINLRPLPHKGRYYLSSVSTPALVNALNKIWSNEDKGAVEDMKISYEYTVAISKAQGKKRARDDVTEAHPASRQEVQICRSAEWEAAMALVLDRKVTKTECSSIYKIPEAEILKLTAEVRRNPHDRSNTHPMRLYLEATVESLALRLHGGPEGHAAWLAKKKAIAEKTLESKRKNGTMPKRGYGSRGGGRGWAYGWGFDIGYGGYDSDGYDSDGYSFDGY